MFLVLVVEYINGTMVVVIIMLGIIPELYIFIKILIIFIIDFVPFLLSKEWAYFKIIAEQIVRSTALSMRWATNWAII